MTVIWTPQGEVRIDDLTYLLEYKPKMDAFVRENGPVFFASGFRDEELEEYLNDLYYKFRAYAV